MHQYSDHLPCRWFVAPECSQGQHTLVIRQPSFLVPSRISTASATRIYDKIVRYAGLVYYIIENSFGSGAAANVPQAHEQHTLLGISSLHRPDPRYENTEIKVSSS